MAPTSIVSSSRVVLGSSSHANPSSAGPEKSDLLKGLQDVYWSDEEEEDAECPLCMEEMDLSDINFKPCPCGYQICRFCHHHILANLNKRCPACRREYTEDGIEFKPVGAEEIKRLTLLKKNKAKTNRELETLGRRHLKDVRVVVKNMVYVVGMGVGQEGRAEEQLATLRSNDYFGQYGKISKLVLHKRPPSLPPPSSSSSSSPSAGIPNVGIYITYLRREDAARAISALDGFPSPSAPGQVLRASFGTAKYCENWLRGVKCDLINCLGLHDWGDDRDCFTKEDLSTLKHTMKDTEHLQKRVPAPRPSTKKPILDEAPDASALPRTASWASRPGTGLASLPPNPTLPAPPPGLNKSSAPIPSRMQPPKARAGPSSPALVSSVPVSILSKSHVKVSAASSSAASLSSTSAGASPAPTTPAASIGIVSSVAHGSRPSSAREVHASPKPTPTQPRVATPKTAPAIPASPAPAPSVTVAAAAAAVAAPSPAHVPAAVVSSTPSPRTPSAVPPPPPAVFSPAPSPAVPMAPPPGLAIPPPPGLGPPSSNVSSAVPTPSSSPPPPPLSSSMSTTAARGGVSINGGGYQPSSRTQALVDEITARREVPIPAQSSPFPDFDHLLSAFGDGQFAFNLHLDDRHSHRRSKHEAPALEPPVFSPFGFGSSAPSASDAVTPTPYMGSFDPFGDSMPMSMSSLGGGGGGGSSNTSDQDHLDGFTGSDGLFQRQSRFDFARKRSDSHSSPLDQILSLPEQHQQQHFQHQHHQQAQQLLQQQQQQLLQQAQAQQQQQQQLQPSSSRRGSVGSDGLAAIMGMTSPGRYPGTPGGGPDISSYLWAGGNNANEQSAYTSRASGPARSNTASPAAFGLSRPPGLGGNLSRQGSSSSANFPPPPPPGLGGLKAAGMQQQAQQQQSGGNWIHHVPQQQQQQQQQQQLQQPSGPYGSGRATGYAAANGNTPEGRSQTQALKEMLGVGMLSSMGTGLGSSDHGNSHLPFQDPAIMSMRMNSGGLQQPPQQQQQHYSGSGANGQGELGMHGVGGTTDPSNLGGFAAFASQSLSAAEAAQRNARLLQQLQQQQQGYYNGGVAGAGNGTGGANNGRGPSPSPPLHDIVLLDSLPLVPGNAAPVADMFSPVHTVSSSSPFGFSEADGLSPEQHQQLSPFSLWPSSTPLRAGSAMLVQSPSAAFDGTPLRPTEVTIAVQSATPIGGASPAQGQGPWLHPASASPSPAPTEDSTISASSSSSSTMPTNIAPPRLSLGTLNEHWRPSHARRESLGRVDHLLSAKASSTPSPVNSVSDVTAAGMVTVEQKQPPTSPSPASPSPAVTSTATMRVKSPRPPTPSSTITAYDGGKVGVLGGGVRLGGGGGGGSEKMTGKKAEAAASRTIEVASPALTVVAAAVDEKPARDVKAGLKAPSPAPASTKMMELKEEPKPVVPIVALTPTNVTTAAAMAIITPASRALATATPAIKSAPSPAPQETSSKSARLPLTVPPPHLETQDTVRAAVRAASASKPKPVVISLGPARPILNSNGSSASRQESLAAAVEKPKPAPAGWSAPPKMVADAASKAKSVVALPDTAKPTMTAAPVSDFPPLVAFPPLGATPPIGAARTPAVASRSSVGAKSSLRPVTPVQATLSTPAPSPSPSPSPPPPVPAPAPPALSTLVVEQEPILSRKPKKAKVPKVRKPKPDALAALDSKEVSSSAPSSREGTPAPSIDSSGDSQPKKTTSEEAGDTTTPPSPSESSPPFSPPSPATLEELLSQIALTTDSSDSLAFFRPPLVFSAASHEPLTPASLALALLALSSSNASLPLSSAVSTFHTLLTTLTDRITGVLEVLPREREIEGRVARQFGGIAGTAARDAAEAGVESDSDEDGERDGEEGVEELRGRLRKRAGYLGGQLGRLEGLCGEINSIALRSLMPDIRPPAFEGPSEAVIRRLESELVLASKEVAARTQELQDVMGENQRAMLGRSEVF